MGIREIDTLFPDDGIKRISKWDKIRLWKAKQEAEAASKAAEQEETDGTDDEARDDGERADHLP